MAQDVARISGYSIVGGVHFGVNLVDKVITTTDLSLPGAYPFVERNRKFRRVVLVAYGTTVVNSSNSHGFVLSYARLNRAKIKGGKMWENFVAVFLVAVVLVLVVLMETIPIALPSRHLSKKSKSDQPHGQGKEN